MICLINITFGTTFRTYFFYLRRMNSGTPSKQRQKRHRGRLGIDISLQSPNGVQLPPIQSQLPAPRLPTRHTSLTQQQGDEHTNLRLALQQRLDSSKASTDLEPLLDALNHSLQETGRHESGEDDGDCFSDAKRTLARLGGAPSAQYFSQFVLEILSNIENLARAKRQREAHAALKMNACGSEGGPSSTDKGDEEEEASDSESNDSSHSSGLDSNGDEDLNNECDRIQAPETAQDLRHVPTQAKFRTTLRSRSFPASRVTSAEFVQKISAHMPFDSLKRPPDLASLQLRGHDEYGSAQWSVVVFPKHRPSLTNHEEVDAFMQWAHSRQIRLDEAFSKQKKTRLTTEEIFDSAQMHFKAVLALKEHICFELSRFVFDKCPTTARFLHGLFIELIEIGLVAIGHADREQDIMVQRHKNVQLELLRLHVKLTKVKSSLASLEGTLVKRQKTLLRERELIIRKRRKLNLLLGADQILIRRLMGLIHHAQELGDDIVQRSAIPISESSLDTNTTQGSDPDGSRTILDDIVDVVIDKFGNLPHVAEARRRACDRDDLSATSDNDSSSCADLIVIDTVDIQTAMEEYKFTLLRLTRMVSAKSPDSSLGWDGLELWDQALFIPPHEEVQDLERDVQRLCRYVEERIAAKRQHRFSLSKLCTTAVQTDISSCMPNAGGQRWRPLHFTPREASPKDDFVQVSKWNWRRNRRTKHTSEKARDDQLGLNLMLEVQDSTASSTSVREEDQRELLNTIVPDGFRPFIRTIPHDYSPRQLDLHQVHNVISYVLNGVWMLVQEDFHRPPRFTTSLSAPSSSDARLIPLTTFHEYVYRIFLQHYHAESVATSRILDLLVSARRLDTQSCKVQLFSQLIGISGVATIPPDSFWFVLKSLHVLQRCCASSGGYFLLDGEGDNEFIPQASAMEALGQLFSGSSNEVLKRLRLKLSGLASVYGAVWIPVYNVLVFILDEWKTGQEALQLFIEEKLFLEHASELDPLTGKRVFCNEHSIVSYGEFVQGFGILQLHVNHSEAIQAYRQLLLDSSIAASSVTPDNSAAPPSKRIDRHRFYVNWMNMILHAVNVSHHQMLRSHSANTMGASSGILAPSNGAIGPGVQLGAISDAMAAANQNLSFKFLVTSWGQMKPDVIRRLDAKFNDLGLQVRLVQQMDASIAKQQQLQSQQRDTNMAWRNLHQLIQIAYTGASTLRTRER